MPQTVFQKFLERIKQNGVSHIFGIVGRESQYIAFNEPDLRFILVRNEQNAGIMAEVFARVSGRAQACFSTMGPGVTNLLTGVASAFKERSPLLAISAQIEKSLQHPSAHQYLDNIALMKPITKFSCEPHSEEELVRALDTSFIEMTKERNGPCFISFPINLMSQKSEKKWENANKKKGEKQALNFTALNSLLDKINSAHQPLIICGQAALYGDYPASIQKFAEQFNIPVATSLAGKGVISEDHPLSVGAISKYIEDFFDWSLEKGIFQHTDLILLLGYDLGEDLTSNLWSKNTNIQIARIDSNPYDKSEGMKISLDICEAPLIENLNYLIGKNDRKRSSCHIDLVGLRSAKKNRINKNSDATLCPFRLIALIQQTLDREDILVVDVGLHKHMAGLTYQVKRPLSYIGSNGLATMGFALPAAIGAKLAAPHRNIVALCGDGGLGAVIGELETCARENIPVVIIVLKNGGYGLIQKYHLKGYPEIEESTTVFKNVDFVSVAIAMGCSASRVESELSFQKELPLALLKKRPHLIEVELIY